MAKLRDGHQGDGCRVTGSIVGGLAGLHVTVTLDRPCIWHGHMVPMRFEATTDAQGRFSLWLPPTSEMAARDGGDVPLYRFTAEQIGSWQFAVPAQESWSLADG